MGRLQSDHDHLPRALTAARELVALLEELGRHGCTVMDLVRRGQPREPWRLYPDDHGIFDRRTHAQFYYHAHDDGRDEDGHFHTVRLFPDHTVHLVAISMAPDGWPRALFTVNYWATGDTWEPVERVKAYARRFRLGEHCGPLPLVRFINLVFRVFQPEIARLQDEKMACLGASRAADPSRDPGQDRSLEILSRVEIDVRQRAGAPPAPGALR